MKKLKLNKKTISVLEKQEMNRVAGGVFSTFCPSVVLLTTDDDTVGSDEKMLKILKKRLP